MHIAWILSQEHQLDKNKTHMTRLDTESAAKVGAILIISVD
jgi:hypothetical protein